MDARSVLDGFVPEERFASDNHISPRTSRRYRLQPDGLPFLEWGGKIYIHVETARDWLLRSRMKHPNPRRKAA
jgi:hypothetical protein